MELSEDFIIASAFVEVAFNELQQKINDNEVIENIGDTLAENTQECMSNRSKAGFLQFRDYAKKSSENYVKLVKSRKDILKAWKNYISSTNHPSVSTFFENQRNNASVNFNKAMNDVEDIERMATITVAMYNNLLNYSDWPHHLSVL